MVINMHQNTILILVLNESDILDELIYFLNLIRKLLEFKTRDCLQFCSNLFRNRTVCTLSLTNNKRDCPYEEKEECKEMNMYKNNIERGENT
jgi:hypothetical protein